jgi:hypothetical protein
MKRLQFTNTYMQPEIAALENPASWKAAFIDWLDASPLVGRPQGVRPASHKSCLEATEFLNLGSESFCLLFAVKK